jgi:type III secretion protein R
MLNDQMMLILILTCLSLLPIFFILTTSFIKVAVVCMMTRDSLGVQQIPPNIVIYGLSLILSFYVMGPVYNNTYQTVSQQFRNNQTVNASQLFTNIQESSKPIKTFLLSHAKTEERVFFFQSLKHFWKKDNLVRADDFMVLIPAFVITELTAAFKIGFLIYLPSVLIDILVSNILMAMGMMMMSPVTISLPIKLLLFVSVDGWSRLIHALLNTY